MDEQAGDLVWLSDQYEGDRQGYRWTGIFDFF